jgi:hypothetical protein
MRVTLGLDSISINVPKAIQIYIHGPSRFFQGPFTGTKVDILAIQAYDLIINPVYVNFLSSNKVISPFLANLIVLPCSIILG